MVHEKSAISEVFNYSVLTRGQGRDLTDKELDDYVDRGALSPHVTEIVRRFSCILGDGHVRYTDSFLENTLGDKEVVKWTKGNNEHIFAEVKCCSKIEWTVIDEELWYC